MSRWFKIYAVLLFVGFLSLWSRKPYLFYQSPIPLNQEERGQKITVNLMPVNESAVSGQAYFQDVNNMLEIYVSVKGLEKEIQPTALLAGDCGSLGDKKYQVWPLFGGQVRAVFYTLTVSELVRQAPLALVVYSDDSEQNLISCGQLLK